MLSIEVKSNLDFYKIIVGAAWTKRNYSQRQTYLTSFNKSLKTVLSVCSVEDHKWTEHGPYSQVVCDLVRRPRQSAQERTR